VRHDPEASKAEATRGACRTSTKLRPDEPMSGPVARGGALAAARVRPRLLPRSPDRGAGHTDECFIRRRAVSDLHLAHPNRSL
jgi:hypothetical protein